MIFVATPVSKAVIDGHPVKYTLASNRRYVTDAPGVFTGDSIDWQARREPRLPANIQRHLDQVSKDIGGQLGAVPFSYSWADNVRTMVTLRVPLKGLPGFDTADAGIELTGYVMSDEGSDALNERLCLAIRRATERMPATLADAGITPDLWERLLRISAAQNWRGGVLLDFALAYDDALSGTEARDHLLRMTDDRKFEIVRSLNQDAWALSLARKYAAGRTGEVWKEVALRTDPVSYFWQAWRRVDQGDYGAETLALVKKAEAALAQLRAGSDHAADVMITSLTHQDIRPGDKEIETWEGHCEAYVAYLRGIAEEQLAQRAATPAERADHAMSAELVFGHWARYANNEADPVIMRATAIALINGTRGYQLDVAEAIRRFELAAAQGSADALNWLGLIYENRAGQRVNLRTARDYFEQAAQTGSKLAKYNLARLHALGLGGLPQDRAKARALMAESAVANQTMADFLAGRLVMDAVMKAKDGSEVRIEPVGGHYPLRLSGAGRPEELPRAQLAFRVHYKLAPGLTARIFPRVDDNFIYSPCPALTGEGERVVWIASKAPQTYIGTFNLYLFDVNAKQVLADANLPVLVRWDQ